jgi:hypothetical protein
MKQAFNLADESCAQSGRVQAVVGLPVSGTIQPSPTTSPGIIQPPPRDVQNTLKRGGAT